MGNRFVADITPVVAIFVHTFVIYNAAANVAQKIPVHIRTFVGNEAVAKIAPAICIFIQTGMGDRTVAQITPVVAIGIGAAVVLKKAAQVAPVVTVFVDARMLKPQPAEVAPVVNVFIHAFVLHDPVAQIAVAVPVCVDTVMGQCFIAEVAAVVSVFVHAAVRKDLIADIAPVVTVGIDADMLCENRSGEQAKHQAKQNAQDSSFHCVTPFGLEPSGGDAYYSINRAAKSQLQSVRMHEKRAAPVGAAHEFTADQQQPQLLLLFSQPQPQPRELPLLPQQHSSRTRMMIHQQPPLPKELLHIVVTSNKDLLRPSPYIPCYSRSPKRCTTDRPRRTDKCYLLALTKEVRFP
jgi:hypothetical protein